MQRIKDDAAIRELGFDYRTDKLEEADYEHEGLDVHLVVGVEDLLRAGLEIHRDPGEGRQYRVYRRYP